MIDAAIEHYHRGELVGTTTARNVPLPPLIGNEPMESEAVIHTFTCNRCGLTYVLPDVGQLTKDGQPVAVMRHG